ncbi:nuclear receptor-interacting protein 1 [Denticeps clupeoides]|uniref:Nuclear receptor-interacting protein 1 n=1 Tax=Denticeps clupeoides TaxID=299321 RepID=A0AAY4D5U3_9TELE|nr:nuclear receptor-interacting protein 1-like [Denticeps clupeoides]XP_028857625.1 nuclear receptor-interacting protein 1-like [Denticeps clupeoides]XP_028857626.1 nuclear receptor-interacting protein 1-like [Denticeps clupeoides]
MTHGEEAGPEKHQDSAALTYLEGLLMHQVAGGQGATATQRCEAGHANQEQGNGKPPLPKRSTPPEPGKPVPLSGVTQHFKKARLLGSDAWAGHESKKKPPAPAAEVNGQKEDTRATLNGSPKGESTLLASLLQSFSSRWQNGALSQSMKPEQPEEEHEEGTVSPQDTKGPGPCHRPASSHLKVLVKKSKSHNNHSSSRGPYQRRRISAERHSDSPQSPSAEGLTCTERLRAVASLVNIRTSPAPSPKPSMACSQLALLLSSEAHLQQYSREQVLKAQLTARSASERLAAMATQNTQDKKQGSMGHPHKTLDTLSSLRMENGTLPHMSSGSSSPSVTSPEHSRNESSPRPTFRERRPFERANGRPSPNCSSLLLQLLNSHNSKTHINGQGHLKDDFSVFSSRGSPLLSDGEHSNPDSSLAKDNSTAESTSSSYSPIDLSLKNRTSDHTLASWSSSPALPPEGTEPSISKWKYSVPPTKVTAKGVETASSPEIRPHHKVTLLQLLLDHKSNENVNKSLDNPDLQPTVISKASGVPVVRQSVLTRCEESRRLSPQCGPASRSPTLSAKFSQCTEAGSRSSPYSVYDSFHSQSIPLDLCKNKSVPSDPSVREPAFSASKLLQNLAQCGKPSSASSPPLKTSLPHVQQHTQDTKADHPVTLLERLTAPVQLSTSTDSEGTQTKAPHEPSHPASEIENLLERRTVLQLLLGNATSKDRVGGKRKREASRGNCLETLSNKCESYTSSNSPSLDVVIKTEPSEDSQLSDQDEMVKRGLNEVAETDRGSPPSLPHLRSLNQEPEPPPTDGLLCHLLKQPRGFLSNNSPDSVKGCFLEDTQEYQGPIVPKKRKFSAEPKPHFNGRESCGISERLNKSDSTTSGMSESPESKGPKSPPEADSPPAKSPPSDSHGFNVLKQLLLSDNCLKDLSQPGCNLSSPKQTYAFNESHFQPPFCNSEHLRAHHNHSPANLQKPGDPTRHSTPGSPWRVQAAQQHIPACKPVFSHRHGEVPATWGINGGEDSQPDSPRLMRSNPILYYMLQKSNAHLLKEVQEQEGGARPCEMQVKVKEEPCADAQAFDHKLNHAAKYSEGLAGEAQRHNGSRKKC